jgi:hypothetical protein
MVKDHAFVQKMDGESGTKVLVAPAALPRVLLTASAYRLASTLLKKLVVFAPRA